jgi:hypothetical protein
LSEAPAAADERARLDAEARKALSLLIGGDGDAGMAIYEAALQRECGHALPIGLHLRLLESAGKQELAARLRSLALARGGNIILKGVAIEGDPVQSADEYEQLLARGDFNARMMESYLMLLMRLGRVDRLAELACQEELLRAVRVGSAELAARVHEALLREEPTADYEEAAQSVRHQRQISPIGKLADPSIAVLLERLREETVAYLGNWAQSSHALAPYVPRRFRLEAWALISRGPGFNVPHIHHRGWATGVYYPSALGETSGGLLCVGPPEAASETPAGWPQARFRPEPGLLVLMPSYYTHWTVPLSRPGIRTAVAFDVVREE